jgi:hypothetical protein
VCWEPAEWEGSSAAAEPPPGVLQECPGSISEAVGDEEEGDGEGDGEEGEGGLDHTSGSSRHGHRVHSCDPMGSLLVTVHDSGPGLTPEQQAQIFDEDVQFNLQLLLAGEGGELELWISKGIVELHHGHLSATSESQSSAGGGGGGGGGSSFQVELPAVMLRPGVEDEACSDSSGEMKEAEASSSDSQVLELSYNVLVVEDSTPSRWVYLPWLLGLLCVM